CSARRRDERVRRPRARLRRRRRSPLRGPRPVPPRDRRGARGHRGAGDALLALRQLPREDPARGPRDRAAGRRTRALRDQARPRAGGGARRTEDDRWKPGGSDRRRLASGTGMSGGAAVIPDAVYTIWWVGLILTLVVFVPLAVYSLHRTWCSARSIQRYAAEALQAAAGIARNTASIKALDATIGVGTDMLSTAGVVERKLNTAATVLAERVSRRR